MPSAMTEITFETVYHTRWGTQVVVVGNIPQLGNGSIDGALRLTYVTDGLWSGIALLPDAKVSLQYHYVVINDRGEIVDEEWGTPRQLPDLKNKPGQIVLRESWRAKQHPENAFYNSAFQNVLFRTRSYESQEVKLTGSRLQFEIAVPRSFPDLQLCVLGNLEVLGNWDYEKPLLMGNSASPVWNCTIEMPGKAIIHYKYGFYDPKLNRVLYLEEGENRRFSTYGTQSVDLAVIRDTYLRHRQPPWKGSGVAIPVFSLRSRKSFGVGAFTDLKYLIDWAGRVGMKLVQILPINDTSANGTWVDSYPYSSISVFALHPQYIDIEAIEGFKDSIDQKEYAENQERLNALTVVDYEEVIKWKLKYVRDIFKTQRNKFSRTRVFKDFVKLNESWLKPYALFCVLRDKYQTPDFSTWGDHAIYSTEMLEDFSSPSSKYYSEILFYYYLQFILDHQLFSVAEYARAQRIVLKGDIAIGVYRDSADAWTLPQLFDMRSQAGAPPDPFSELGQNWGFPTYRWEVMAQNNYAWWQNRLQYLSRYFDAFRIDHILGFFRIWQIPYNQIQGLLGYFNPALPVLMDEFNQRGIPFDYDRFCKPYITEEVLLALFEENADEIKSIFLEMNEFGRFSFKEEFADQRKIFHYLKVNPGMSSWRDRLFQLHSEVLFIQDLNLAELSFHPRIDFQKTFSFKALHPAYQTQLQALYHDYFYNRQEDFWKIQGRTRLPAIKKATDMLICGEDLGMIPACVPDVMKELDLLTLEIQRMSKNPQTEFLQESDIPYLSVCSTSTHDMAPVRAWWEESEEDYIARFYHQELHLQGLPPRECNSFIAEQIISQHLHWPGMWTVFPIQDLLALSDKIKRSDPFEERINIPANPDQYWQYRMHLYLEDLLEADDFNLHLKLLIQKGGR